MCLPNVSRLSVWLLLLTAIPLAAQDSRLTLVLRTANGETTFHIAERIALKLTFSSPNDTQYKIDPAAAIGPECGAEILTVNPSTGWSDPMALYRAQDSACAYSGPGPQPLPAAKPLTRTADLNQWVRFDRPGIYEVKISSSQITEEAGTTWTPVPLQSKVLRLQIIPATSTWQADKLQSIRAGLKNPGQYPIYNDAEADLRYLATPAGVEMMTSSMRETCCNLAEQSSLGLIGLPAALHDLAVLSMKGRITEADFPITTRFVYTLSFLNVRDGSNATVIREQLKQTDATIWKMIFSSLHFKSPAARVVTVQTLLTYGHSLNRPDIQAQMAHLPDAAMQLQ